MKLIPVIDLKKAIVVTARRGKRSSYAPSDTLLCRSSRPQAVLSALLDLYPFETLYIADLDAICGYGSNLEVIRTLHHEHPALTLWVDNGLTDLEQLCEFARPVIGSESLSSCQTLAQLLEILPSPVLSLDFHTDNFIGPESLNQKPELWTRDIISMSLSRVGSASGPDFFRFRTLMAQSPKCAIFAAGGIRDHSDLQQLQSMGMAGALLSTALHQGQIDTTTLRHFSNP